jgi:transcriptional regulator with PAS, ATPase and Fis domain
MTDLSPDDDVPTLTVVQRDRADIASVVVEVTSPEGQLVVHRLGLDALRIGTDPECDIAISDARVSRAHCEIRLMGEGLLLKDLGSKNGTLIGKLRVHEVILPIGEAVTIGDSRLRTRLDGLPTAVALSPAARFGDALGGSVPMRALFAKLDVITKMDETVLLLGESGTGKELLARGIHDASPRRDGPFVIFDCSAVTPTLIEAELFGHERGAFTGAAGRRAGLLEEAAGGTLFIDEVGELPLDLQPKLLRAIEAHQIRRLGSSDWLTFDARIIAATHRDLRARVVGGQFRQDLYYRLSVMEARIPPLRERKDDIPLLVERILASLIPPRSTDDLPTNAIELLKAHDWPGNVRELRNTVTRLVSFPGSPEEAFLPSIDEDAAENGPYSALLRFPLRQAREMALEEFEKSYVVAMLRQHDGSVTRAAATMGVSRQFVYRLMDRYEIQKDRL